RWYRARPQGAGRHRRPRSRDLPPICRCRPRGVGCCRLATADIRSLPGAASTGSAPVFVNEHPVITSPHNAKLTQIRRLQPRLQRRGEKRFVAEGGDLLRAAADAGWPAVYELRAGIDVEADLLDGVSALGSGTRALAVYEQRWAQPTGPLCIALWGVHDPGNV